MTTETAIDGAPVTADTPRAYLPISATDREVYDEPARRMAAAYLSWHLGIGLEYAYETYAKGGEIGDKWIRLARLVQGLG